MSASKKPELLFVSPRFLFPVDSGGRIRTTQILRGMQGGQFDTVLVSPATSDESDRYAEQLQSVAARTRFWPQAERGLAHRVLRLRHLFSGMPIPVVTDRSAAGEAIVRSELERRPAAVVFDFAHAAVLAPRTLTVPSILFTHNVEAEIFERHADVATNPVAKRLWRDQFRKMEAFERAAVGQFDTVVAVSERDLEIFREKFGVRRGYVISTGVDLDFFNYRSPGDRPKLVFTGSMDWLANIDGIEFLMDEVWPLVISEYPDASLDIVGRDPPKGLVQKARVKNLNWHFTGFVDDVREYAHGAAVYVIPLRVGGGTRLKVYEAMAMGAPVVSTSIGVEGLPVVSGKHFLAADSAAEFAGAVISLLRDQSLRRELSLTARSFVEDNCSYEIVAREFEEICLRTIAGRNE